MAYSRGRCISNTQRRIGGRYILDGLKGLNIYDSILVTDAVNRVNTADSKIVANRASLKWTTHII